MPTPKPKVWMSVSNATRVLAHFKSLPEMDQSKKMMNQEAFLQQCLVKLRKQLRNQKSEDLELEIALLMRKGLTDGADLGEAEFEAIMSLTWMVEAKVKLVREQMEQVRNQRIEVIDLRKAKEERLSSVVGREKAPVEAATEMLSWFPEDNTGTRFTRVDSELPGLCS
ncbi:agamous-like MADS-box protein AGL80 [Curcuma longa]|uniref:agamous-like MADS-box protein AGL80 n=1 Tax=Curcuma longa TaxID=136217 RepID=UPI003D9DF886